MPLPQRPDPVETPFANVSEASGVPLSPEAASMMATRYAVAAALSRGKRALELACGAGAGLGLLAREAAFTVGADIDTTLLEKARHQYAGRVPLVRLSAEALPFAAASFDVILFLEASYYVPDVEVAVAEVARVLSPGGTLLFVNANPERPDFIKSPYSVHYHSAREFRQLLERRGFAVTVSGAFPVDTAPKGAARRLAGFAISAARKTLEALHLVPTTMAGRARLKRLLFGKLMPLPAELHEGFAPIGARSPVEPGPVRGFKVIYVEATKR